jgi:hypothetical protein
MNTLRLLLCTLVLGAGGCAHAGHLADLRIYDRHDRRELPIHWHEGRAYVAGQPGNEYEVVVRNRAGEDLLAVISVDGVNAVSGETASPGQTGYVLGARQSARIAGWRKSLDETAAFYFTALPDSYAARTARPDHVGVIGVALFQRKLPPATMPLQVAPPRVRKEAAAQDSAAERSAQAPAAAAAPLGTGHGRRESSPVQHVAFERRTAEPAEVLTIYYDSRANLIARGVLASPYARRHPEPFPGRFVADP